MNDQVPLELIVYIVDDDPAVRKSLSRMLQLLGYKTSTFDSAESILEAYNDTWAGCIVADLRLPGLSGVELQSAFARKGRCLPFIVITGHGDVTSARDAFRVRALDFIEKPIDEAMLLTAIETGMKTEMLRAQAKFVDDAIAAQIAKLTPREREVLALVGKGLPPKEIATQLDITPRTAELHKAHIMEKVQARNVSELVRLALRVERPREGGELW